MMMIGFDTGVFVYHSMGHPEVVRLWAEVTQGNRHVVVSAITLYEIQRLALRGLLREEYARTALESIPVICEVVWLDTLDRLRRAASLAQGLNLLATDSFVLAACIERCCSDIYTTDSSFAAYKKNGVVVHVLRQGPSSG
ncbi:MAG: type II toxin-antitoxin system VapC family toxin [Candidatus Schekmanbacteria bacterium]|nr:type II toxin-antitoxin system VapC family toxin [Candidatus Schekmanbacteria bacterium]